MFSSVGRIYRFLIHLSFSSSPACLIFFSFFPQSSSSSRRRRLFSRAAPTKKAVICKRLGLYLTRRRISRWPVICMRGYCERCGFIYDTGITAISPFPPGKEGGVKNPPRDLRRAKCRYSLSVCGHISSWGARNFARRCNESLCRDPRRGEKDGRERCIATLFHICFMVVGRRDTPSRTEYFEKIVVRYRGNSQRIKRRYDSDN